MALSALISGAFFLIYGRISSPAGCTIGGMIEYWAQQAVDVCIVLITVAALASARHSALWTARRHWIQTSMAPVLGIVVFLPLVLTVVVQIIWRFRSAELPYCWVPRTPVYARWVAIDGWRLLIILSILGAYIHIATLLCKKRDRYHSDSPRHSPIDSEPERGLFSQSMHNVHRWAWSKLGLEHEEEEGEGGRKRRSYYESFKRSFVISIVRRFFLTVDIPSPTLPASIFNQCGKDQPSDTRAPTDSLPSSSSSSSSSSSPYLPSVDYEGPRRWYSAVARLMTRRSQVLGSHTLRRSHTAPVLTSDAMGLCSCVFKRRGPTPEPMDLGISLPTPNPCTCPSPYMPRSISVKRRHEPSPPPLRPPPIYGPGLDLYASVPFSEQSDESSARIVEISNVLSLEDGHWAKVVEKCRGDRQIQPVARRVSRLYVYPLAYLVVWLPSAVYSVVSTYVYYTAFQGGLHRRSLDMAGLPAHWTEGQNMNRMWPYYQRLTKGVWGGEQLAWLAVIQSLHMLGGAVDALLFWLTE